MQYIRPTGGVLKREKGKVWASSSPARALLLSWNADSSSNVCNFEWFRIIDPPGVQLRNNFRFVDLKFHGDCPWWALRWPGGNTLTAAGCLNKLSKPAVCRIIESKGWRARRSSAPIPRCHRVDTVAAHGRLVLFLHLHKIYRGHKNITESGRLDWTFISRMRPRWWT